MEKLIVKFRKKLKEDGRTLRWFHQNYFEDISYMSFIQQMNGYYAISDDVKEAIKKYLED